MIKTKTTYHAHSDIIHDGRIIKKGEVLPEKFPEESIKSLLKDRYIGEAPPSATTVTKEKGEEAAPAGGGDETKTPDSQAANS